MSAFQRARTDEQRAERRQAILASTRELALRDGVADVTLNGIAREVGLAKSNVLRYFDSREAILLGLLAGEYSDWVDDVVARLGNTTPSESTPEDVVARLVAHTVIRRPLLMDLLASTPTVLEHNLSAEVALEHRSQMHDNTRRLLEALATHLGEYDRDRAKGLLVALHAFIVMVWAFERPSPGMAAVYAAKPELRTFRVPPETALRESVATFLVGLRHRAPQMVTDRE